MWKKVERSPAGEKLNQDKYTEMVKSYRNRCRR